MSDDTSEKTNPPRRPPSPLRVAGYGDWVRIVHDDDPERPEEPARDVDVVGRCGLYESYDDRPGVPRRHHVRLLTKDLRALGVIYVFEVEVVTPAAAIAATVERVEIAKAAIVDAARTLLAAETELEGMRPHAVPSNDGDGAA